MCSGQGALLKLLCCRAALRARRTHLHSPIPFTSRSSSPTQDAPITLATACLHAHLTAEFLQACPSNTCKTHLHSPIALTSRSSSLKGSLGAFSCCSMLASFAAAPAAPQLQRCVDQGLTLRFDQGLTGILLRCAVLQETGGAHCTGAAQMLWVRVEVNTQG